MQTTLRRRVWVLALAVGVATLSACTRGFDYQTDQPYQPAEGVNNRDGEVDVLGALVVSSDKGSGLFIASLVNNDQAHGDRLTGVQGQGVQVASGSTPRIQPGGLLNLAAKNVGGIPVRGSAVSPGGYVQVRLTFDRADPVTMRVPVVTATGPYASVTAQPTPSPSTSPSSSSGSSGSSSPSPAESPTASNTAG